MGEALELAHSVLGLTSPNPAVGCVIVRGGRVVGRGATAPGGRPHAETVAVGEAGAKARGATSYVSFEPCAHFGQTPPCARALVDAGIARVVVGCVDPFPKVRGRGIAILKKAGIDVSSGVLEEQCRALNEGFITRIAIGRPFAVLKLAATLDGRIAAAGGDSRWISSKPSREMVHRWRREADAVMVGAGTVLADNPRLTCRIEGGRDPVRVIVDGELRSPADARVFTERSNAPAILVTARSNFQRARRRYGRGRVEVLGAETRSGEIDLNEVMEEFGRRGWCKVLIEGGAHLAGAALRQKIVDRVAMFLAPRILGCGLPAVGGFGFDQVKRSVRLAGLSARPVGDDWLLEGRPVVRMKAR